MDKHNFFANNIYNFRIDYIKMITLTEKVLELRIKQFESLISFDTRIYCDCINLLGKYKGDKYQDYLSRIQTQREKLGVKPR
jgi:hypothetical protein